MPKQDLQGLLSFLARSLVDHPQDVEVEEHRNGNHVQLDLKVNPEDVGRVIGKHGRVANSMRALLMVVAARNGSHVTMDVVNQD